MTDPYEKYLKTGVKTPRERPKGTRMGRGHFKLIASVLLETRPRAYGASAAWRTIVEKMADALAQTNPSFRRETFLAACGVETDG